MAEIMKRPEGSRWTDEQWRAIAERGRDILVAAAAGSGKTAVLVERIIRKLTDPADPVNIDELLVVTFTNAAASEMRERIGKAIDKALAENPGSLFLRRQQTLLNKAAIMTLHAFCMSVVKRHYYLIDLDPGFRLLDETEAELIREEVMESLFEDYYGMEDAEPFFQLVDRYSNDRNDEYLQELIRKLYDFSRSHPWPDQWLENMAAAYQVEGKTSIDSFSWAEDLKKVIRRRIRGCLAALEEAMALCREPGGPSPYMDTFVDDMKQLNNLFEATFADWQSLHAAFSQLIFSKLSACRGKEIDGQLKEQAKKIRDNIKTLLAGLQADWFGRSPAACIEDLKDMAPSVLLLRDLVSDFGRRYQKAKKAKGLLDFADLEHDCLAILRKEGSAPDQEAPSVVAEQYRAQFNEVLVDEYQDTNLVQEAIIQLITKDGKDGGNLFMVGDVKQSIYGFRLAEPGLFIEKYKRFGMDNEPGLKIDLAKNFRSRNEVIDGTNYLFRQLMDEEVGGIAYDEAAALRFGADFPDADVPVELEIINRAKDGDAPDGHEESDEYKSAELEACAIADRIQAMVGDGTGGAYQVYDRAERKMRPIRFRDIAILMRATHNSAPAVIDILRERGIPAYAELSTGYFDAVEVSNMLSLLKVIDNPYQDIPIAAVLRSPIMGLSDEELAAIRLNDNRAPYYEALKGYAAGYSDRLADKLDRFLEQLREWTDLSKTHSVASVIWQIYRDTGYYDYAAGEIGGTQRQANLKALYDRARQYEKTSFRGLFRFLRFIERMRDRGDDLGAARALSEQEDVVRIMTIHKSKGLEFPVVFVAGLSKKFNKSDMNQPALLHKSLGFGTRWIDPVKRMSMPTLPYLAIKERMNEDLIAEEMRILYVALTRAKEKLILLGTLRDADKTIRAWQRALNQTHWLLPAYTRSTASSFLDWVGPCLIRHRQAEVLHDRAGQTPDRTTVSNDRSAWRIIVIPASGLVEPQHERPVQNAERLERIRRSQPVTVDSSWKKEARRRLEWLYPFRQSTVSMVKQTVTEIKAQQDYFSEGHDDRLISPALPGFSGDRPRFMQNGELSATERGTALHIMMQHIDFQANGDIETIRKQGLELVDREILTHDQEASLDYRRIAQFLQSPIGEKIRNADKVTRECPFSLALDTSNVYSDWSDPGHEPVLVQGVIDCLIEDKEGLTLLDYKTDRLSGKFQTEELTRQALIRRYRVQLDLYKQAIETIWKRPVAKTGLYAFDGGYFIDLAMEGELR